MTKLTFNGARFCNYARWDLTVNSSFYRKMALLMLGSLMTVILFVYLVVPAFKGFHFGPSEKDPVSAIAIGTAVLVAFFSWVSVAYTFHGLINRQSRILELTIPASTIERFVWHVLVVTVGTQLVLCVSIALADLVHLLLASVYGIQDVRSLWTNTYCTIIAVLGKFDLVEEGDHMSAVAKLGILGILGALGEVSFLLLVNAWKYRYTVVNAIVVKVAIGLVESFLLGIMFNFGWLNLEAFRPSAIVDTMEFLILVQTVVIVVEIVWAYRLFSRAQVTSRSNP